MNKLSENISKLSAEKKELLKKELQKKLNKEKKKIVPGERGKTAFPLSSSQQRLFFLENLDYGNPFYNIPGCLRFKGSLNLKALEEALNLMNQRHDILRMHFLANENGEGYQKINNQLNQINLELKDVQGYSDDQIQGLITDILQQPFYLEQGPLWSSALLQKEEQEFLLVLSFHHIIFDGWSLENFIEQLLTIYKQVEEGNVRQAVDLNELQYTDYVEWEKSYMTEEEKDRQLAFWKKELEGCTELLNLPLDYKRPKEQNHKGDLYSLEMSRDIYNQLSEVCKKNDTTLFMITLAAFNVLLSRHTNQDDITVGFPISCRDQAEIEDLIGLFVNTLPIRTKLSSQLTFTDLLKQVKANSLQVFENKYVSFDSVVECVRPTRELSYNPIFQVLFSYQNAIPPIQLENLIVDFEHINPGTSKFDLSLDIFEGSGDVLPKIVFEYNTDLFERNTIHRIANQYLYLLGQISKNLEQNIFHIDLMSEKEKEELVALGSGPNKLYNSSESVMTLFEKVVQENRGNIALSYKDHSLTYGELDKEVNRFANYLNSKGVQKNDLVGISVDKSMEMVTSILAVLKLGAAYVPIDPQYPIERQEFIIKDSGIKVLITSHNLNPNVSLSLNEVIALNNVVKDELKDMNENYQGEEINLDDTAYIIYTSGTTGQPKGAIISYGNLLNAYYGWEEAYALSDGIKSHLQMASFSFDVCTGDIMRSLLSGAKLVLCPPEYLTDSSELYQLIVKEKIDFAEFVPAVFRHLIQYCADSKQKLEQMKIIVLGSDIWYMNEYKNFQSYLNTEARLINSYGLTEDTIDTSYFEWNKEYLPQVSTVPIGKPLANKQMFILDAERNIVPIGVIGELYIGGNGVAKGYKNRHELTNERFINHSLGKEPSYLYKTGDLARFLPDGNIELVGRMDSQVKIRGFRVELNEVSSVLLKFADLKDGIVVDFGENDEKQLIAYYVESEKEISTQELRAHMKIYVPDYMVPNQFIKIDQIPLNANGKVNRKLLPLPDLEKYISSYISGRTLAESMLQDIWEQTFKQPRIGVNDNFFELGGHSLMAMQITSQIRKAFHINVPLKAIFENPTISKLAKYISKLEGKDQNEEYDLPEYLPKKENKYEPFPLTDVQQAYWVGRQDIFELGNVTTHSYDELEAEGIRIEAFEQAWNQLINRHEMLRTVITEDGYQQTLKEVPYYKIKVRNLENLNGEQCASGLQAVKDEMSHQQLCVTEWPTFDLRITKLPQNKARIHFSTDALFWDVWSFVNLVRELVVLYEGKPEMLPALDFSFRDYVFAEQEIIKNSQKYKEAREYWNEKVKSLPPAPDFPIARNPRSIQNPKFTRYHRVLERERWEILKKKASGYGITVTALLLAIHAEVFAAWSKESAFSLNLTFLSRHAVHPQVTDIVGEFTSLTLLSIDQQMDTTFIERARKIQKDLWVDLEHNYISGVEVLRAMTSVQGEATQAKMPVVFTSALVVPVPDQEDTPIPFKPVSEDGITQTSQVWLDCGVWEDTKRLMCNWDVVEEVYPEGFIKEMFESYWSFVEKVAVDNEIWEQKVISLIPNNQKELRIMINDTEQDWEKELLHASFERQALQNPNTIAIEMTNRCFTYQELDKKSNSLGNYLIDLGAKKNQVIGIIMDKGWEQAVGGLSILKANAAYLPINPELPKERIDYLIQKADVKIVLTQSWLDINIEENPSIHVINVDTFDFPSYSEESIQVKVNPDDLAYVIFTSGSTGDPKGVMISHQAAMNTILDINDRFSIGAQDKALALSSFTFDLSVYDFFGMLATGGTIVIPDKEKVLDPIHWFELINEKQITVWNSVPQLMSLLVEYVYSNTLNIPETLRLIMLSGDWIPLSLPDQIKDLSKNTNLQVISLGGATEASIWSILYPIEHVKAEWKSIPYGKPMKNQKMYVLNTFLEHCPIWGYGDIYIGGLGVAKGYWKDEEKTANSFIIHPRTGERIYKTGDIGRYLPDGNIELLGREDNQVKIQGHRVELGEIETNLNKHSKIEKCIILASDKENIKSLIAFYITEYDIETEDLHCFLENKIASYMIPSQFIRIDSIPLTPNGKVDYKILNSLINETTHSVEEWEPPVTEMQQLVSKLWSEILKFEADEIGINHNFFEMGGDSMQAIRMMTKLQKELSTELSLRDFYQDPSVRSLANHIEQKMKIIRV
ncbi:amino acid adenylation domain-containing protein [Lysinibacillus agricola]|uniref:amino acid adenylation domain-containing protein n=1 Tax=Lysinibacillus agricola TaxID=2590012 RepID=UPI003C266202